MFLCLHRPTFPHWREEPAARRVVYVNPHWIVDFCPPPDTVAAGSRLTLKDGRTIDVVEEPNTIAAQVTRLRREEAEFHNVHISD